MLFIFLFFILITHTHVYENWLLKIELSIRIAVRLSSQASREYVYSERVDM